MQKHPWEPGYDEWRWEQNLEALERTDPSVFDNRYNWDQSEAYLAGDRANSVGKSLLRLLAILRDRELLTDAECVAIIGDP